MDDLEEHKAAGISLINLRDIKGSLARFIKGVLFAQLSLSASAPRVCHSRYEFQENLGMKEKKKSTLASEKSDIPLTQRCLHKEMKNERRQSRTRPCSQVFLFFFHGQRKTSLPSSEGIVVEYDI